MEIKTLILNLFYGSPYNRFKINESMKVNQRSILLTLEGSYPAEPGQFVMVWLPGVGEKPYSLAESNPIQILIVDAGPFSHSAQGLKSGDSLWLRGPYGQGFHLKGKNALLVGGGYGVAPLAFLANRADEKRIKVEVCIGAKTQDDVLFEEKFLKSDAKVWVTTEDGSKGERGLITDIAEQRLNENHPDALYGCGPIAMLEKLEELGQKLNIPTQLSWEAHMRCGIGVCGSCELIREGKGTGWLVCQDGPVGISMNKKPARANSLAG